MNLAKNYIVILFFMLCATLPVSAQSPSPSGSLGPTKNPANPSLLLASPEEGQTILGNNVTTTFQTGNFEFRDFTSFTTRASGEGHMHLWLDEDKPTRKNAKEHVSLLDYIFHDVPPGLHTLTAELVRNDHSSFIPAVKQTTYFKIITPPTEAPSPVVALTKPAPTSAVRADNFLSNKSLLIIMGILGTAAVFLLVYIITLL